MIFEEENVSKVLYSFGYTWINVKTGERDDGEEWLLGYSLDDSATAPIPEFEAKMKEQLINGEKFTKEKAIAWIKEVEETGFDIEWQMTELEYRNVNEATRALESRTIDEPVSTSSVVCLESAWLKSHFDIS